MVHGLTPVRVNDSGAEAPEQIDWVPASETVGIARTVIPAAPEAFPVQTAFETVVRE